MKKIELEQQRCSKVIDYLKKEIDCLQDKYNLLSRQFKDSLLNNGKIKIKDGNELAFYESSVELNQQEQELVIQDHFINSIYQKKLTYQKMVNNPYFGRIDYLDNETRDSNTIYIGISSFSYNDQEYIIDWRSKIAGLFYESGTENDNMKVLLKRQFVINNGKIELVQDVDDEVITDKVLLNVLSNHSNSKMKHIVNTIQSEQNQIIRNETKKHLLINGVAGSGKSAVLMQRIAYLLYRQRDYLDNSEVLMITPNKVFSNYLSEVLPSLGEADVLRYDVNSYIEQLTNMVIKNLDDLKSSEIHRQMNQMDTVLRFKELVLNTNKIHFKPIYLKNKEQLFTISQLEKLWYTLDNQQSVDQRLQTMILKLQRHLQLLKDNYKQSDEIQEFMEVNGEDYYEQMMQNDPTLTVDEIQDNLIELITNDKFSFASQQIENLKFINYPKQYFDILGNTLLDSSDKEEYIVETIKRFQNSEIAMEDFCYYLSMKIIMSGNIKVSPCKELFIDEIQDLKLSQLLLISSLYPNARYTFCGDLNQDINNNNTISNLSRLINNDFWEIQLNQSYRNTKEITDLATAVIKKEITSVNRSGCKPQVILTNNYIDKIKDIYETVDQRIAVITQTEQEAKNIYKQLHGLSVKLVDNNHPSLDSKLLVMPLDIAKGLEFDIVILLETDKIKSDNQLYTMITRAMHKLIIMDSNKPLWLDKINNHLYEVID